MALSFALHGLAAVPLLLAGTSGSTSIDEPVFVEVLLAAPAPGNTTSPADPPPNETSIDLPVPDQPPPVNTADIAPPLPEAVETKVDLPAPDQPPPVEIGEIADRKVELPKPDEPPPLAAAELKPAVPAKPVEPPKPKPATPPQAQPRPKPPAPASPAPSSAAQKPAVTQTETAPNTGTDRVTQTASAALPAIVFSQRPRFRLARPAPYPPRAIELGQQGDVVFRVRLQPDGSVAEIVLWRSSGHDLLDKSALAAVRGFQFLPELRNGHAVAAWVEFPIRFHLR
jgi:protein TonB